MIPRPRRAPFLNAAVARLAPGNPTAVQIGACKAVAALAKSVAPAEVQAASQQMFAGERMAGRVEGSAQRTKGKAQVERCRRVVAGTPVSPPCQHRGL